MIPASQERNPSPTGKRYQRRKANKDFERVMRLILSAARLNQAIRWTTEVSREGRGKKRGVRKEKRKEKKKTSTEYNGAAKWGVKPRKTSSSPFITLWMGTEHTLTLTQSHTGPDRRHRQRDLSASLRTRCYHGAFESRKFPTPQVYR